MARWRPGPRPGHVAPWQRGVQVTLVDAVGWEVLPGAAHRSRVDVGRVHLGPLHRGGQGRADRTRAAAQIDDHVTTAGQGHGLPDEELGTPPRHEDAGSDGDPQSAELGPAEDLFQRQARNALADHGVKFGRSPGGRDEQPGLVLGENAARGAKPGDDNGIRDGHRGYWRRAACRVAAL